MVASIHDDRRLGARDDARREPGDLQRRYGAIGISAVRATLPYCAEARNPAYAPKAPARTKARDDRGG